MKSQAVKRHPNHDKAVAFLLQQPLEELHKQYKELEQNRDYLRSRVNPISLHEYRKTLCALAALEQAISVYCFHGPALSPKAQKPPRLTLLRGSKGC